MTDRSALADRIIGSRATLLGLGDSLENVITTTLDDGALCYVVGEHLHYELHKDATESPSPPNIIAPIAGPGRWVPATGGSQGQQGAQGRQGSQGAQGTQGAGFQGAQGATGVQGSQGAQGTQGAGFQGAQGATGVQGFQGAQGQQGSGAQGAQGSTGPQGSGGGAQGAQGATGVQGAQGAQGQQGSGAQGAQGATGTPGTTGAQGSQGAQGRQGATGTTGTTGTQGSQGAQGNQGATGTTGTTGAQGAQGAAGTAGTTGAQGSQGAQGRQGATGTTGTTGAQGAQGATGTTGAQGGAGAQGATGAGTQGAQGNQGATGTQGFQGSQGGGFQGAQGFQGSIGPGGGAQGAQGATGVQGFQGATGAGTQGAQGATGTAGTTGAQGSQGAQGRQGATGTTGTQGAQGANGATGTTGAQGATGAAGATGTQGFQGAAGTPGAQGSQGRQGATGTAGTTGSQGAQGATGAGSQGAQGAQGATGTGAQGAQGFQGAAINPLTQVFYVDSANAGTATGSIAQPYASPTAAFAAHTTGNITLLIAPGTYATALALTGTRNVTMVGLCEPSDQTVILGAVQTNFSTTAGLSLTMQNLTCTTITDISAVQVNINLIDVHASGTITGSGVGINSTVVRMSSVLPSPLLTTMRVEAITSVTQVIGENALINGVFSAAHSVGETFLNTFTNCQFTVAPTTGPLICNGCKFVAGITGPTAGVPISRLNNCTIEGDFASTTGSPQIYLTDCRVGTDATTTQTIGNGWGAFICRNVVFGPKSSGHIVLGGTLTTLQLDAASERSLFSAGNGQATIGSSSNAFIALDQGEQNAFPIDGLMTLFDGSAGQRLYLATNTLTGDKTITLSVNGLAPLQIKPVDVYGTNGHTLTIQTSGAVVLKTIASTDPVSRYLFQAAEDSSVMVYVGQEPVTL